MASYAKLHELNNKIVQTVNDIENVVSKRLDQNHQQIQTSSNKTTTTKLNSNQSNNNNNNQDQTNIGHQHPT